jgi:hypothetical protein
MAFVQGYDHDVFVSYAHQDDQTLPGAREGWVCTLVDALRVSLASQLGRAQMLAVWRDLGLAGNAPVTEEIVTAVRRSAVLLVILSEGYLASDWCERERNGFMELVGASTRRLFIVELMPIDRSRKPAVFQDRVGYPFWITERADGPAMTLGVPVPTVEEREYYVRLNRLAQELAAELKRMAVVT